MISEALKKRIADREAAGWKLSHWVMKDKNGLYFVNAFGNVRWPNHPAGEPEAGKAIPVFTRTVKIPRGHSFSWALARMREGKKVRRASWKLANALMIQWGNEFKLFGSNHSGMPYEVIAQSEILANDWMLAE